MSEPRTAWPVDKTVEMLKEARAQWEDAKKPTGDSQLDVTKMVLAAGLIPNLLDLIEAIVERETRRATHHDEATKQALAQVHSQDALRKYSVAEVKQIVYPLVTALDTMTKDVVGQNHVVGQNPEEHVLIRYLNNELSDQPTGPLSDMPEMTFAVTRDGRLECYLEGEPFGSIDTPQLARVILSLIRSGKGGELPPNRVAQHNTPNDSQPHQGVHQEALDDERGP